MWGIDDEELEFEDDFDVLEFSKARIKLRYCISVLICFAFLAGFHVLQEYDTLGCLYVWVVAMFYALYNLVTDMHAHGHASGRLLYIGLLVWFIFCSIFRHNGHFLNETWAWWIGIVTSVVGSATFYHPVVSNLKRNVIFAIVLVSLTIWPQHDHNVFHISVYRTGFRMWLTASAYWYFVTRTYFARKVKIEFTKKRRFRVYRLLVLRNAVRSLWIPWISEVGTLVAFGMLVLISVASRIEEYFLPSDKDNAAVNRMRNGDDETKSLLPIHHDDSPSSSANEHPAPPRRNAKPQTPPARSLAQSDSDAAPSRPRSATHQQQPSDAVPPSKPGLSRSGSGSGSGNGSGNGGQQKKTAAERARMLQRIREQALNQKRMHEESRPKSVHRTESMPVQSAAATPKPPASTPKQPSTPPPSTQSTPKPASIALPTEPAPPIVKPAPAPVAADVGDKNGPGTVKKKKPKLKSLLMNG